jgi:hypothetical protein
MFTPVKLPFTKNIPIGKPKTYYVASIESAWPWIEEFGLLDVCRNRDIRCVVGWMKPQHRMPIHMDMGDYGPTPWALDFTTDEFKDCSLEIYENLGKEDIPTGKLTAPPHNSYSIPILAQAKAKLVDSWSFTNGAVKFDPGKNWHTGYNPNKEKWMAVVSLRSFFIDDWYAIEEKLKSVGML